MMESQFIRRNSDRFAALPGSQEEDLFDQIKLQFARPDQQSFGIGQSYNEDISSHSSLPQLLSGLSASAATTVLFAVFGFLATLGLPEAGTAAITLVA